MKEKFDYESAVIGLELSRAFALDKALRTPNTEASEEQWKAFYKRTVAVKQVVEPVPITALDDFGFLNGHGTATNVA